MKSLFGKVYNIFVLIVSHFFERFNELILENIRINVLFISNDNLGHAELNIWNVILGSLN